MVDTSYLWEKLYIATHALATGRGSLKERLHSAYLSFAHLGPEDFPEELQNDFAALEEQMTRVEARADEGTVAATLQAIDDDEAAEIAGKIVDLYNTLATNYPNRR